MARMTEYVALAVELAALHSLTPETEPVKIALRLSIEELYHLDMESEKGNYAPALLHQSLPDLLGNLKASLIKELGADGDLSRKIIPGSTFEGTLPRRAMARYPKISMWGIRHVEFFGNLYGVLELAGRSIDRKAGLIEIKC